MLGVVEDIVGAEGEVCLKVTPRGAVALAAARGWIERPVLQRGALGELTGSEKRLAELMCRGYMDDDIADDMGGSREDVKRMRVELCEKVGAKNDLALVAGLAGEAEEFNGLTNKQVVFLRELIRTGNLENLAASEGIDIGQKHSVIEGKLAEAKGLPDLSLSIMRAVNEELLSSADSDLRIGNRSVSLLTEKGRLVLSLFALGLGVERIGEILKLRESSVMDHIRTSADKMDTNRFGLLVICAEDKDFIIAKTVILAVNKGLIKKNDLEEVEKMASLSAEDWGFLSLVVLRKFNYSEIGRKLGVMPDDARGNFFKLCEQTHLMRLQVVAIVAWGLKQASLH